jgi:DNA polymerase Ligase (LigD)
VPRFVILEHDWPTRHYDLMLEAGSVLRSWRLAALPEMGQTINAEPIGNHRLAYLDYEGPVSGGRGDVKRIDFGTCEIVQETANRLIVRLQGQLTDCQIELQWAIHESSTRPR